MKKWQFIIMCLISLKSYAQSVDRQLIGSSGNTSELGNLYFDWSLGEVIIDQSNLAFTQGFQQNIDLTNVIVNKKDISTNYNTIITPGDGSKNESFVIDNLPFNTELFIFDKWGNKLFYKNNYQGEWNGQTSSGKELPDGVYVYFIKNGNGELIYKGTITIKRK